MHSAERIKRIFEEEYEFLQEIERATEEKMERKRRRKAEKQELMNDTAVAPLSTIDSVDSAEVLQEIERDKQEKRERKTRKKAEKQDHMTDDTSVAHLNEIDSAESQEERRERRRRRKAEKRGETITDEASAHNHTDEFRLQEIENEQTRIERKRKRKERRRNNDENEEQPIADDTNVIPPSDPETYEFLQQTEREKEEKRERKRRRKAERQKQLNDDIDEASPSEPAQSNKSDQGENQPPPSLPNPSGASSDIILSGKDDNEVGTTELMDRQLVVKREEGVEEEEEVTILRFKKGKDSSNTAASQPQIKQEPVDDDNIDVKPPREIPTAVPVAPALPAFDPAALFGAFATWMQQQAAAAAAAAAAPAVPAMPAAPFPQPVPVELPLAVAPAAPAAEPQSPVAAAASPDNCAAVPSTPVARPVAAVAVATSNQRINPSIDNELLHLLSSCTPAKKKELISLIKGNTSGTAKPEVTPRKSIARGVKTDGQENLRVMAKEIIAKPEHTRKRGAPKGNFGNKPRRTSQKGNKRKARDGSEKENKEEKEEQQKSSVKKRRISKKEEQGRKSEMKIKKNEKNVEENEELTDHDFWTGKIDQQTCPRCKEHIGLMRSTRIRHYQKLHYDIFFAATNKSMGEVERFVGQQLGVEDGKRNENRACLHCPTASLHKGRMGLIDHMREEHPVEFESMKRKYKEVAENRQHTDTKGHDILMGPSTSVVRKRSKK